MRKVMLLAAMLAMVLAVAAPAFAQATIGDDTQVVDCSQVQVAVAGQYGDANAAADDGSAAFAANSLGISQTQVNACLGEISVDGSVSASASASASASVDDDGSAVADEDEASMEDEGSAAASEGSASAASEGSAVSAAEGELPETGGASLLALGAGALLVAGGLVARRIVR